MPGQPKRLPCAALTQYNADMAIITFTKMHGLGNDFVLLDRRGGGVALDAAQIRALADRHRGVGFDQMISLEPSSRGDAFMRIHNADGGEVAACGNGARCAAALLMADLGRDHVVLESGAGLLDARAADGGRVSVDMGSARLEWQEIPLTEARDTLHLGITAGPLADPVAVNMGNPHAVFFVDDAAAIDLAALGPGLEHLALFPQRANIGVAQVLDRGRLRLRVWERGVGITEACGSGACAAVVAAARRGLTERRVEVTLDGGALDIHWRDDGHVVLTGPVATSFSGQVDIDALSGPS